MYFKNVSLEDMYRALSTINQVLYNQNVEFNRIERRGKQIIATLKVKDSRGKGAKLGFSGRHTINACWHVHGAFFDSLLKVNSKAVIKTALSTIYKNENGVTVGNWEDKNIGSIMKPLFYSESCEC